MTLDEAIKTEKNTAEANQRVVDTGIVFNDMLLANYQRCAEEHRQIAEWLKELKQLREQATIKAAIKDKSCSNCKYWLLDKNDETRRCSYCFEMDEWVKESEVQE